MKYVPPILVFLTLLFLMALPQQNVYSATDKVDALPNKPDAPVAVTSTPTPLPTAVPTGAPTAEPVPAPGLGCLRINFEITGDVARTGTYEVKELNGRPLASWAAKDGWQDSGWIRDLNISFDAVYVQVFYNAGDGSELVEMSIVNPAPGTEYGWLARGMCHALEVGWH